MPTKPSTPAARRASPLSFRGVTAVLARRRVHLTWSALFAVVTVTCLVVLTVTGILLGTAYRPSAELVTYDGPYEPLAGARVSAAFDSVMTISWETAGGMLVRQTHHWAALVLPASLMLQLLSTFFTGAFRRPRRAAWLMLVGVLVLVLVAGWSGYALPDDMLSGTGLRIVEGVMLAIPVVGSRLALWLFGGGFPGVVVENLYAVHLLAPVSVAVLLVARAVELWRAGPTVPARAAASGALGLRLWPDAALRALGLSTMTTAVLVLLGTFATVTPLWAYGPADPGDVGAGSQPDWYMGFLDGALRLVPAGWEAEWFGATWTFAVLVPLLVVGAWFVVLAVYPYLESWVTDDAVDHHVLERPRHVPVRTGVGVVGVLVYGVLWGAASADVVATAFHVSFESVITALQVTLVLGPPVAFEVARRVAVGLQRRDREITAHGRETGRVLRTARGGYVEVHAPASPADTVLLAPVPVDAPPARPVSAGRPTVVPRLRGYLARRFADGHVRPRPGTGQDAREPRLVRGGAPR